MLGAVAGSIEYLDGSSMTKMGRSNSDEAGKRHVWNETKGRLPSKAYAGGTCKESVESTVADLDVIVANDGKLVILGYVIGNRQNLGLVYWGDRVVGYCIIGSK
jgi:hypothetical protein